jgi:protein TonB
VTKSLIPGATTGPRDFANDIESVFSPAQASTSGSQKPTAPVVPPPRLPAASSPSTEELKQQAARLQEQLSTLLFTETHAAPQESSPVSSTQSKPAAPVAEVANKVLELAHETRKSAGPAETSVEPKPDIRPEPKPAPSARTPAFTSLDPKVEEVAIPAWLRPISQHAEMVVEEPPKSPEAPETAAIESAPAATPESEVLGSSSSLSEAAVFGGRLLGGDEAPVEAPAASGSKKGLFLGLAAALALLAGGGFWYYQHTHAPITDAPAAQSHVASVAAEPVASTNSALPSSTAVHPSASAAAPAAAPSAPANTSLAPPSTHNSTPAPATSTLAAAESRSNNLPATHPAAPQPEPPKKAAFGKVHLATPVIRGSVQGQASGEPLPSIDAPVASVGADALAAASHHKGPAAPLPVGGDVKPAQLIKSVAPMYPPMAKAQRIYGNVTLDALVDTSGNVAELKVLSGPPLLHRAALDAVKQWKYSPALLDGTPTSMHLTVTVQFRTQ